MFTSDRARTAPGHRRAVSLTGLALAAGLGLHLGFAATGAVLLVPQAVATPAVLVHCLLLAVFGALVAPVVARVTRARLLPSLRRRTLRFTVAGAVTLACWAPMADFATSHSETTVDNVYLVPLVAGLLAAAYYWRRQRRPHP